MGFFRFSISRVSIFRSAFRHSRTIFKTPFLPHGSLSDRTSSRSLVRTSSHLSRLRPFFDIGTAGRTSAKGLGRTWTDLHACIQLVIFLSSSFAFLFCIQSPSFVFPCFIFCLMRARGRNLVWIGRLGLGWLGRSGC